MTVINLKTEEIENILKNNSMVILDFWATWCEPCRHFTSTFKKVSTEYPNIIFGKIDIEQEPELAKMFQVRSIPTLIFIREKIIIFSNSGILPEKNFKKTIKQLTNLDMKKVYEDLAKAQKNKT
jgi:thioredoxin 1